jgi:hypothetical protein
MDAACAGAGAFQLRRSWLGFPSRSLQVDGGVPLELRLKLDYGRGAGAGFGLGVLLAIGAIGGLMLRRRASQPMA